MECNVHISVWAETDTMLIRKFKRKNTKSLSSIPGKSSFQTIIIEIFFIIYPIKKQTVVTYYFNY